MKLTIKERKTKSKGELNRIRHEGNIPAVLYSAKGENSFVTINGSEFLAHSRNITPGGLATSIFEVEVDGKILKVVVKDIQYDPTTYAIIHLDFLPLQKDAALTINVPIHVVGLEECVGIKLGGFLRQVRRYVPVRCLSQNMPKEFILDIRDLQIGSAKRGKDLEVPNNVKILILPKDVLLVIAKR